MIREKTNCESGKKSPSKASEDIHDTPYMEEVDPRPTDVLLGRGSGVASWKGNVYFRQVIWENRGKYKLAGRMTKAKVAEDIIKTIASLDPPGRFVESVEEDVYCLVSHERAFEKTCQALREKKVCAQPILDPRFFCYERHGVPSSHGLGTNKDKERGIPIPQVITNPVKPSSCSKNTIPLVELPQDFVVLQSLQANDPASAHLSTCAVVTSPNIGVRKKKNATTGITNKRAISALVPKRATRRRKLKPPQRLQTASKFPSKFHQRPPLVSPAASTVPWERKEGWDGQDIQEGVEALIPTTLDFGVDAFTGCTLRMSSAFQDTKVHDLSFDDVCPTSPKMLLNDSCLFLKELDDIINFASPFSSRAGAFENDSIPRTTTISGHPWDIVRDDSNDPFFSSNATCSRSVHANVKEPGFVSSDINSVRTRIVPDVHEGIATTQSHFMCNSTVVPGTGNSVIPSNNCASFVYEDIFDNNDEAEQGHTEEADVDRKVICCFAAFEGEMGDVHDIDEEFLLTTIQDCLF